MSADIINLERFRFTHERAPAGRLSDRELYLRALSRQKVEDDLRWAPADDGERRREDAALLNQMIGALDPFTGPGGDAA
jgi:hypothetical protein